MRAYKPKLAALILACMCVLTGQETVAQPSQGCDKLYERSYDKGSDTTTTCTRSELAELRFMHKGKRANLGSLKKIEILLDDIEGSPITSLIPFIVCDVKLSEKSEGEKGVINGILGCKTSGDSKAFVRFGMNLSIRDSSSNIREMKAVNVIKDMQKIRFHENTEILLNDAHIAVGDRKSLDRICNVILDHRYGKDCVRTLGTWLTKGKVGRDVVGLSKYATRAPEENGESGEAPDYLDEISEALSSGITMRIKNQESLTKICKSAASPGYAQYCDGILSHMIVMGIALRELQTVEGEGAAIEGSSALSELAGVISDSTTQDHELTSEVCNAVLKNEEVCKSKLAHILAMIPTVWLKAGLDQDHEDIDTYEDGRGDRAVYYSEIERALSSSIDLKINDQELVSKACKRLFDREIHKRYEEYCSGTYGYMTIMSTVAQDIVGPEMRDGLGVNKNAEKISTRVDEMLTKTIQNYTSDLLTGGNMTVEEMLLELGEALAQSPDMVSITMKQKRKKYMTTSNVSINVDELDRHFRFDVRGQRNSKK